MDAERILQRALSLARQPSSAPTANSEPMFCPRLDVARRTPRKAIVSAFEGKLGPAPLRDMTRFLEKPASAAEREASTFAGMMWKEQGNELFKKGSYVEARDAYLNSIRLLLSQPKAYDPTTVKGSNPAVTSLGEKDLWAEFLDVVACANNIAQSYSKEKNHMLSLQWLMEVHRMYDAFSIGKGGPHYKWNAIRIAIEEFTTTRMKAFLRQASIFNELGNSSAVASAALDAFTLVGNFQNDAILQLGEECDIERRLKKRHPDPEDISAITCRDAALQTRGVWNKLQVGKGNGHPPSRKGFSSVLWKGMYYVFGGLHGTSKAHCDGWVLNLRDLKQGWRKVPYPEIDFVYTRDTHRLALHGDKAYLFLGQPNVHVFNLRTETWSTIRTTMRGVRWATIFPGNRLESYACVVSGNTIYYFGGTDGTNRLGRNAIVALDLTTLQWELVSGKVEVNDDPTLPGVREHPVMWMDQGKLWITLGNANRQAEWLRSGDENGGAPIDHSYQDLWSYDLQTKQWVDERCSGNPPCLRTEVEYAFNKSWNRVIVHGGYCASLAFSGSSTWEGGTGFTYFGDTFAWNPETKRWSQVITRGFPTYRAAADLFTDEQTGRAYLFGGYTNTHYTPSSRNAAAQTFNDLWELCIEVPGSNFKESDFEVDERFSKLGPWKRCFTCGSVGRWLTCAGACRNTDRAAAFCGVECQKKGWKDHKELNKCRKV
ncbi:hypothetical protein M407DRAFT_201689 [Tulasnella calospora MUT 4182]|uniref:MYND-type domain-containing protein n=1 Tax=Tulasnella calospora MUT 4182 TaxID=1051891 RepID=A0A0C3LY87_9AGAM|nr:hypothetical protein M407DRAFT_201689 [Tulasnella calospora MUT 4182]